MICLYSDVNILTSGSTLESSPNSSGDKAAIRSSRSSRVTLTGATCKQTLTIKPYLCYEYGYTQLELILRTHVFRCSPVYHN